MWWARIRLGAINSRKPYPTDLTDEQWELLKPMLPSEKPKGRKRHILVDTRT
jgi:transposase